MKNPQIHAELLPNRDRFCVELIVTVVPKQDDFKTVKVVVSHDNYKRVVSSSFDSTGCARMQIQYGHSIDFDVLEMQIMSEKNTPIGDPVCFAPPSPIVIPMMVVRKRSL